MLKSVFILIISILLLSCSIIPTGTDTIQEINIDGVWQSTYVRVRQISYDNNPSDFEQTSTLTITGNTYHFAFDPPAPQTLLHFNLIKEISGQFSISDSLIFFYDSTGIELKQELVFKVRHDTLSIKYPIKTHAIADSLEIHVIPIGALPWGYAMNTMKPFVKIK